MTEEIEKTVDTILLTSQKIIFKQDIPSRLGKTWIRRGMKGEIISLEDHTQNKPDDSYILVRFWMADDFEENKKYIHYEKMGQAVMTDSFIFYMPFQVDEGEKIDIQSVLIELDKFVEEKTDVNYQDAPVENI